MLVMCVYSSCLFIQYSTPPLHISSNQSIVKTTILFLQCGLVGLISPKIGQYLRTAARDPAVVLLQMDNVHLRKGIYLQISLQLRMLHA